MSYDILYCRKCRTTFCNVVNVVRPNSNVVNVVTTNEFTMISYHRGDTTRPNPTPIEREWADSRSLHLCAFAVFEFFTSTVFRAGSPPA
jgi:hypothetical protein